MWANPGNYTVTFEAFNMDNPAGVSTTLLVRVQTLNPPVMQSATLTSNAFQFNFSVQASGRYSVQYTTNLTPPSSWLTLQYAYPLTDSVVQVSDPAWTNAARFYRVVAQ